MKINRFKKNLGSGAHPIGDRLFMDIREMNKIKDKISMFELSK